MKANLFTAVIGCFLFGAFLMSATGNEAAHQSQNAATLPPSIITTEMQGVPFTFFYTLVTTFTNGGSVNMNLVGEEAPSPIWDKPAGWGKED